MSASMLESSNEGQIFYNKMLVSKIPKNLTKNDLIAIFESFMI